MKINLSPQRRDDDIPVLILTGDILSINGDELDLSDIPEGATYTDAQEINPWLTGSIENVAGEYELTVLLPHGANPETYQSFPEPVIVVGDGPIDLPKNTVVTETTEEIPPSEEYPHGATKFIKTTTYWKTVDVEEHIVPNVPVEEEE